MIHQIYRLTDDLIDPLYIILIRPNVPEAYVAFCDGANADDNVLKIWTLLGTAQNCTACVCVNCE